MIPLFVLAGGPGRVFVSAALVTLALVGASAAIFGPTVWAHFLTAELPLAPVALTLGLWLLWPELKAKGPVFKASTPRQTEPACNSALDAAGF